MELRRWFNLDTRKLIQTIKPSKQIITIIINPKNIFSQTMKRFVVASLYHVYNNLKANVNILAKTYNIILEPWIIIKI